MYMLREEIENSFTESSKEEMGAGFSPHARGVVRRTDFLKESFRILDTEEQVQDVMSQEGRKLFLRYLYAPAELISDEEGRVRSLKVNRTVLEGPPGKQKANLVPGESQNLACQLLIKSIGYKSLPIPGIPFDLKTNTIPNTHGCIVDENGVPMHGLYCAGWLKRGPVGIIDSTLRDSVDTFRIIKHDIEAGLLIEKTTSIEKVLETLSYREEVV